MLLLHMLTWKSKLTSSVYYHILPQTLIIVKATEIQIIFHKIYIDPSLLCLQHWIFSVLYHERHNWFMQCELLHL
jgi:hypothetical protein